MGLWMGRITAAVMDWIYWNYDLRTNITGVNL